MKRSFVDVALEFIDAKKAARYSMHTVRSYFGILDKFSLWIGGRDVAFADIEPRDIRSFLGSLTELADKTIYNHHIALSSLWTFAMEQGYVDQHIVRMVQTPKVPERRVMPFTEMECRRILQASRNKRDYAIVMVLLDSGIRRSEICSLSVEDWSPGSLKVFGKGKKERFVPISEPTEKAIRDQLLERKIKVDGINGGGALFACEISQRRMTSSTIGSIMRRLRKYSGIRDIHCHRFRHTFAITFLRNGGDIYTLQKILGHSCLDTVKIYLDIVRSDVEAAHRRASPILNWKIG
jgi:site-specific recombinase XerD